MKRTKLPIFIVNLERQKYRRKKMEELCNDFNLIPTFIDAVDGSLLNSKKIKLLTCKKESIKNIGRPLTKGEIACALSHKLIYNKMVSEDIDRALVLEDDIYFDEELILFLDNINVLPNDWELVLLGHHAAISREIPTQFKNFFQLDIAKDLILRKPSEKGYGTYGYLINQLGASKLINHLKVIVKPIDHYTGDSTYINLYILEKPIILIEQNLSNMSVIEEERIVLNNAYSKNSKLNFLHLIWYRQRVESFISFVKNILSHIGK